MSRAIGRLQFNVRDFGDDDELMDQTRREKRTGFKSAVPDDDEKARFFKMSGVLDKYERTEHSSESAGHIAKMSFADKATHASLGTKLRAGGQRIDGQYQAPYQQAMVVISVEQPFEVEYKMRKEVPQGQRAGMLGTGNAMNINEGNVIFSRAKAFRTAPAGFPDISGFAHLGGLDLRTPLQVVGIAQAPNEHILNGRTDFTVAVSGTPWTFHTGETRIPAMARIVAIPKGLVSSTPEGDVPYYSVTGHSADTLYPAVEPFEDVDVSVAAANINEELFGLIDSLVDKDQLKDWFGQVDSLFKTKLFNEDGYDLDAKKPIQLWAEWSAIHHALADNDVFNAIALNDGDYELEDIHKRIKSVLDQETNSPDFARFIDVFGQDLDTDADQELQQELLTVGNKVLGAGRELTKHLRKLRRVVEMHMNRALMEQLAWNSRMSLGRSLRSTLPGQPLDLLV